MAVSLPGTTLPMSHNSQKDVMEVIRPIFAISSGGLLLSQISEMTGLSASTIQNWVKRGWVSRPEGKKYKELQVARILLINLLRPAMRLEEIVTLLSYINGSIDDRSDDIIPETDLYCILVSAIFEMEKSGNLSYAYIGSLTDKMLKDYEGPVPDAPKRLKDALCVMLFNVAASRLMERAAAIYKHSVAP